MWQKKFPRLAGMIGQGGASVAPSVAPVGESQPALATRPMERDLQTPAIPAHLPATPMLRAQPNMNMNEQVKRKALTNIAMGRKGF